MNETAQFLGEREGWRGATLVMDAVHGLWGGWHLRVGGDGRVAGRGVPPSAPQSQFQKRIAGEAVHLLFELCIQHDLIRIQFPPRDGYIPDEAHTTLMLTNGMGEIRRVTRWAHDPEHEGFEAICYALKALT